MHLIAIFCGAVPYGHNIQSMENQLWTKLTIKTVIQRNLINMSTPIIYPQMAHTNVKNIQNVV